MLIAEEALPSRQLTTDTPFSRAHSRDASPTICPYTRTSHISNADKGDNANNADDADDANNAAFRYCLLNSYFLFS